MKINLVKHQGKLVPAMAEDQDKMKKAFVEGEAVEVKIKKFRNYQFHKKYFSLISLVFENLEEGFFIECQNGEKLFITDVNDLHYHVKMLTGLFERKMNMRGNFDILVKSISFEKMDNLEFQEFYEKVYDVLTKYFAPYLGDKQTRKQVEMEIAGYF